MIGCGDKVDKQKAADEIIQTDRDFSRLSVEKGIAFAFDHYMADSATILSDGSLPITGRKAINEVFAQYPPGAGLVWEPDFVDVAASGDLGYTIGHWEYSIEDSLGERRSAKGRYVTIWKKQVDGSWKYVFDTGSDDPKE
jgi:ketosteroid isomerase-like protein